MEFLLIQLFQEDNIFGYYCSTLLHPYCTGFLNSSASIQVERGPYYFE